MLWVISFVMRQKVSTINYKILILKIQIHYNDNHFKLHLCYFQDLLYTNKEEAKMNQFENVSHKLSNKTSNLKSTGQT